MSVAVHNDVTLLRDACYSNICSRTYKLGVQIIEAVCRRDALRKSDAEIAAMEKEREIQMYESAQV